ncbi:MULTISPECIES: ABC transporter permease [Thalassospira]|uniref:Sugar ABC transporter permease n=2 Tax=Thalassospira tepidiphila TaxID=393657 RepID=A0A853L275_9PROT|nr:MULTISPECIES: ABC transporter permease [Thalassospira]KXJ55281.1 MAG: sugar ABC transporter permease [Thalassospira sp. Nap_22]EKF07704.1 ABC transporter permease [Thalassospira profundimaris WP0211]MBP3126382.1 ABC transporter permease [Thalassospira sp. ER-Se-21-Dark]NJB75229.1 simple sugar transport system permease protein [Thalassospira tepidiphila]OAZ10613.1 sugar ABC transporter permease [Thalassospira tepidiphila MCCC 1A03514]
MDTFQLIILLLDATLRTSTPLILAALAGMFSERSGTINLALEGMMLGGAFSAAAVAFYVGSPWVGLLAAIATTIALSLLHGFACITHKGNQVVSGMAINILMSGLTALVGIALFAQGGKTPALDKGSRFQPITFPGADAVQDVPVLGLIYSELLSGHNILVYVAFLAVPAAWWVMYRTRFGLRLRAVGENPGAVDTAGIGVVAMRYRAVICSGVLVGMSGAYLSTAQGASFLQDMTAGKGYIALAAMVFGKWRPFPALAACLLFGFLDAAATRLQGVVLPGIGEVPVQLVQALPYILTVILLAGFIGRAIPPKALGRAYVKER